MEISKVFIDYPLTKFDRNHTIVPHLYKCHKVHNNISMFNMLFITFHESFMEPWKTSTKSVN